MATKDEIHMIMDLLHKTRPSHTVEKLAEKDSGAFAVVKYLFEHQYPVRSKDISDSLNISTARMAVLLKKGEAKGLIEKSACPQDARVTLVNLTPQGLAFAEKVHRNHCHVVEDLIDEFGIDYLIRLLDDIGRFKAIMERNHKELEETIHV